MIHAKCIWLPAFCIILMVYSMNPPCRRKQCSCTLKPKIKTGLYCIINFSFCAKLEALYLVCVRHKHKHTHAHKTSTVQSILSAQYNKIQLHWSVIVLSSKQFFISGWTRLRKIYLSDILPTVQYIQSFLRYVSALNLNTHAVQYFRQVRLPFWVYIISANVQSIWWTGVDILTAVDRNAVGILYCVPYEM